jgi:hypothetical protein
MSNEDVKDEGGSLQVALGRYLRQHDAVTQLCRIAARHARVPRDSVGACELVWEVLGDVSLGVVPCDPEHINTQVRREVRRRANRLRRGRSADAAWISLEDLSPSALREALASRDTGDRAAAPYAAALIARIRAYAIGDDAVQELLGLYERGLVLRRDALSAGMTNWIYRAARERLMAYADMAYADMAASTAGRACPSEETPSRSRRARAREA